MVRPGVLHPRSRRAIRSFIGQFAIETLGLSEDEYEEFATVEVEVLNPERTLFEKPALLHHLASQYPESADELRQAARHLYDVFKLMTNPELRSVLESRPGLAAELASDIDRISQKWGWPHTIAPLRGTRQARSSSPLIPVRRPSLPGGLLCGR